MGRPRLVFMGTPEFAVPSFQVCADSAELVAVVTQPDKPKGRGQALATPPVKAAALARDVPVLQPSKIRGTPFHQELRALAPDLCVVVAYGKILPPEVLEVPRLGCVNVHASLLPRFRGAAPIQWAIASGDTRTGITLIQMDAGMDTGPILASAEIAIERSDTSAALHDKLAALGGDLLRQQLPALLAGARVATPQPKEGVVYAPMIRKEDGWLDFRRPAAELERRIRAFSPWPGAFTRMGGTLVKVQRAQVLPGKGQPGEVLAAGPRAIEVACGEGSLAVEELQPEGRRVMTPAQFLASRKIAAGSFPFEAAPLR